MRPCAQFCDVQSPLAQTRTLLERSPEVPRFSLGHRDHAALQLPFTVRPDSRTANVLEEKRGAAVAGFLGDPLQRRPQLGNLYALRHASPSACALASILSAARSSLACIPASICHSSSYLIRDKSSMWGSGAGAARTGREEPATRITSSRPSCSTMDPAPFPWPQQDASVRMPRAFNASTMGAMHASIGLYSVRCAPVWLKCAGIVTGI